jgi:hypothetical protein
VTHNEREDEGMDIHAETPQQTIVRLMNENASLRQKLDALTEANELETTMTPVTCDYEVKAFKLCQRKPTVRIERNGCFCAQHAKRVLASLKASGFKRTAERIK